MRKSINLLSVILLFIALIATGCSLTEGNGQSNIEKAIPVVVKQVEIKSLEKNERFFGYLSAENDILIIPKIAGKVKEIYVKQGEHIKKDQLIMKLDDTDMLNALQQAEAGYQSALSNLMQAKEGKSSNILNAELQLEQAQDLYNKAKENYEKNQKLFQENVISKSQLDQAETSYIQAENGLETAKNALESAKSTSSISALESQVEQAKLSVENARRALDETKITSPIEGEIASLMVETGEMAAPQSPIAQVINQNNITVKLNVTESLLNNFQMGGKVKVKAPSIDTSMTGDISFIGPAANSQTLTFPIEIKVDNKKQNLKSGMLVEVIISKTLGQDQLIVPTEAVLGVDGDNFVFIVNGEKAEKRKITVKKMSTKVTSIATGLSVNDLVIIKGQYELENNSAIEVVREEGSES